MAPSAPVLACLPLVSLARLMVAQCRDLVGPQAVVNTEQGEAVVTTRALREAQAMPQAQAQAQALRAVVTNERHTLRAEARQEGQQDHLAHMIAHGAA